jgi:Ubiquitin carboxyl-terminal hydrolase
MSAVLQCLIHCLPLQRFFLRDIGHHHEASLIYHNMEIAATPHSMSRSLLKNGDKTQSIDISLTTAKTFDDVQKGKGYYSCLASEMDKLFLQYFSSSIGFDVFSALRKSGHSSNSDLSNAGTSVSKGQPLLLTEMLSTVWQCRGMRHLAGYDQRDAHEVLHAFLDNIGKSNQRYNQMIQLALDWPPSENIKNSDLKTNTPKSDYGKVLNRSDINVVYGKILTKLFISPARKTS